MHILIFQLLQLCVTFCLYYHMTIYYLMGSFVVCQTVVHIVLFLSGNLLPSISPKWQYLVISFFLASFNPCTQNVHLFFCNANICRYFYSLDEISYWPSWSWSSGSWIFTYICNQCISSLTLWIWILLMRDVLDTTLCDKVCQWLAAGRWFSPGTTVPPPIRLTVSRYNWNIIESVVIHHKPKGPTI